MDGMPGWRCPLKGTHFQAILLKTSSMVGARGKAVDTENCRVPLDPILSKLPVLVQSQFNSLVREQTFL